MSYLLYAMSLNPHHILLIPCLSDNRCFWAFFERKSSIIEKVLEFTQVFFYNLDVLWYSCFSEIFFSDLELRLVECIYICILPGQSLKNREYLTKRDERYIYRDDVVPLSRWKIPNIRILIRCHTSVSPDALMELECPDINCIDVCDIMCEQYLGKTPCGWTDIECGFSCQESYSQFLEKSLKLASRAWHPLEFWCLDNAYIISLWDFFRRLLAYSRIYGYESLLDKRLRLIARISISFTDEEVETHRFFVWSS